MKRFFALLLMLSLTLTGCSERLKEPVTFYYLRSDYEEEMTEILATEQREASGHREDLSYLMALYLMGPAEDELQSPIPRGTNLLSASQEGSVVTLELAGTINSLSDIRFTLACSCLTMTCLEITDAQSVTIHCGERSVTLDAETLLLEDLTTAAPKEDAK